MPLAEVDCQFEHQSKPSERPEDVLAESQVHDLILLQVESPKLSARSPIGIQRETQSTERSNEGELHGSLCRLVEAQFPPSSGASVRCSGRRLGARVPLTSLLPKGRLRGIGRYQPTGEFPVLLGICPAVSAPSGLSQTSVATGREMPASGKSHGWCWAYALSS